MMKKEKLSLDTRSWLGVAYAHIPTRDACKPFAKLRYRLEKLTQKKRHAAT